MNENAEPSTLGFWFVVPKVHTMATNISSALPIDRNSAIRKFASAIEKAVRKSFAFPLRLLKDFAAAPPERRRSLKELLEPVGKA